MKKIRKVNRVMKISTLLSLAFACTVSASTYGQNYKLSMNKQDCSISEVLKEIEKNKQEYCDVIEPYRKKQYDATVNYISVLKRLYKKDFHLRFEYKS